MLSQLLWAMLTIICGRAVCAALLVCPVAVLRSRIVQDSGKTAGSIDRFCQAMDGFSAWMLEVLRKACTGTLFGVGDVFGATDGLLLVYSHTRGCNLKLVDPLARAACCSI